MHFSAATLLTSLVALSSLVAAAPADGEFDIVARQSPKPFNRCVAQWEKCKSSGDPNEAFCQSQAAGCCKKASNKCNTSPDANHAYCASETCGCYGNTDNLQVAPSYCQSSS